MWQHSRGLSLLFAAILPFAHYTGAAESGTCEMEGGKKAHYYCPKGYELMLAGGGKEDCAGRRRDGTFVEFVKPMQPLSLAAALRRVAQMTEGKDPERVFLDPAVEKADFAQKTVTPPEGRQGSLAIIRQLLVDGNASSSVEICLVQGGYRVQLAHPEK